MKSLIEELEAWFNRSEIAGRMDTKYLLEFRRIISRHKKESVNDYTKENRTICKNCKDYNRCKTAKTGGFSSSGLNPCFSSFESESKANDNMGKTAIEKMVEWCDSKANASCLIKDYWLEAAEKARSLAAEEKASVNPGINGDGVSY